MLTSHGLGCGCSVRQRSSAIVRELFVLGALAWSACGIFPTPACAQGSLSTGTIQVGAGPYPCPASGHWYSYTNGNTTYPMNCFSATVSCPNTQDLSLTFAYLNPAGIVAGVAQAKGVIVLFGGSGGTAPASSTYAGSYFTGGYEIVEEAWASDWEPTYDPYLGTDVASLQNAACRPATLLNYVYTTIFPIVQRSNSAAALCAQGTSAGSAQIAYSLAYYGAESYLDNVELLSGPVFGDVEQGCQVPSASPVTVCGQTNDHGRQYGCQLGKSGSTWTLSPTYVTGAKNAVADWTNDSSCADSNGKTRRTTKLSQQKWLAQSLVDQSAVTGMGATPTFTYLGTGMSGWLCRSVESGTGSPNNSSPQGQVFYANIGQSNSPPNYGLYAVDNCEGSEGVDTGNVPGFYAADFNGTIQGSDAIIYDMIGYTSQSPPFSIPAQCVHRSHP